jgi:hypothetical protein
MANGVQHAGTTGSGDWAQKRAPQEICQSLYQNMVKMYEHVVKNATFW